MTWNLWHCWPVGASPGCWYRLQPVGRSYKDLVSWWIVALVSWRLFSQLAGWRTWRFLYVWPVGAFLYCHSVSGWWLVVEILLASWRVMNLSTWWLGDSNFTGSGSAVWTVGGSVK